MKYYYLAHGTEQSRSLYEWELQFEHRTGINLMNPFLETPEVYYVIKNKRGEISFEDYIRLPQRLDFVRHDYRLIANPNCLGVVAVITHPSIGCLHEICYAEFLGKQVYVIYEGDPDSEEGFKILNHWFWEYNNVAVFKSRDDFETQILNISTPLSN